ncbi:hypothetical protein [Aquimarina mytili]|uniref:Uncharacterized protein n=1 Tax=Aquimarina mytili TaxID=874423 RepID=A0A937A209_9FLAO|nr:hypothetical protein [Aquimarina mytili]MBL0686168.1 hypothetical protein [Aquimarina mytili]
MTGKIDKNIIGFFASFNTDETDDELVKSHLWNDNGLKNKLAHLNWEHYGDDLKKILFQVYVKPIRYERKNLKEIENYRRKEKAIGIPIILDNENFFKLTEADRRQFFVQTIVDKLRLVELKIKQNKLNFDISRLITDVKKSLNYEKIEKKPVPNNDYNSLWQRVKTKFNL